MGKTKKKGKDDSKAAAKAAKKAKQEKLADKKATKSQKKDQALLQAATGKTSTSGKSGKGGKGKAGKKPVEEDEDLDALLASIRAQWEEEHTVHEEKVGGPPSRRANATLTPCPLGNDLWLFGGEYFDGDKVHFYPDLYRLTPGVSAASLSSNTDVSPSDPSSINQSSTNSTLPSDSNIQWRTYSSSHQPGPRSAHQVVPSPANGGQLWLFGGEFAAPKGGSFHHYRDLWVFNIATHTWDRIDTKVRPSARSGHRMALFKHFLVLFGGFIDTGARTNYLNDLWIFDTTEYKWYEMKQNDLRRPLARSGFSFLNANNEGLILHGGYCKRYIKGQRTQGVALDDTWILKFEFNAESNSTLTNSKGNNNNNINSNSILPTIDWQKRRKIGYFPNPTRSGCTMANWTNKNMSVLFGGVTDTENDEESLESVCHKELFAYQMNGNGRWISLNLKKKKVMGGGRRRKKNQAATVNQPQQRRGGEESSDEEDNDGEKDSDEDENDENGNGGEKPKNDKPPTPPSTINSEDLIDPDDPQRTIPLERYNAMLAVQRNTLYVYGGIHETPNREYTLDDFYTLDLNKLEKFICLKECPIDALEWNESDDSEGSDSGSDSDSESDSSSDEDDEEEPEGVEIPEGGFLEDQEELSDEEKKEQKRLAAEQAELRKKATTFIGVSKETNRSEEDSISTPQPGEKVSAFYERSKTYWAQKALETSQGEGNRGKELRRDGFALAEKMYNEYKPLLEEIEKIQAEAGLEKEEMKNARSGVMGSGPGVDSRNRR